MTEKPNHWKILRTLPCGPYEKAKVQARCLLCKETYEVRADSIKRGRSRSCGCQSNGAHLGVYPLPSPARSLYEAAHVSESTFYRWCKLLGVERALDKIRAKLTPRQAKELGL